MAKLVDNEVMEVVHQVVHIGSCSSSSSSSGYFGDEINNRISKVRAVFTNLRHLWRQKGISLNLKGLVYNATVKAALLYGHETWPLKNRLEVFDHQCLHSIVRIG